MSNPLLPCPFCGGEADIEEISGSPFENEPYTWAVGCKECNIGWYMGAMSREQSFVIPGRLPGYNELKDGHWAVRKKKKESGMEQVIWAAKAAKIKSVEGFAEVKITCYEKDKRRDQDNVQFGASKIILDALQQMGVLRGDGQKYIQVSYGFGVDRDRPRVEVEIKEEA